MLSRPSATVIWFAPGKFASGKARRERQVRAVLATAWRRWRTRRALGELDARMLRDIGASVADARAEASKPFWRT